MQSTRKARAIFFLVFGLIKPQSDLSGQKCTMLMPCQDDSLRFWGVFLFVVVVVVVVVLAVLVLVVNKG